MSVRMMKVLESEVEGMLSRIASKYGIAMSELKACAYGEVECANSNLELEVLEVSSGIVYDADVESEWLLEVPSVSVEEEDVKEKTYEVLSKLCEDLEKCGSMVELEVTWLRGMTMECIDLCKSDAILNGKYEEALFRYGVMSESFESGSNGVEESKSEVVMENSLSLMEESYQYAPVSVPTVEAPVVVVPTVEVPVVVSKKVVKEKVAKEKVAKAKVVKEKVVKSPPVSTVVSACESASASASASACVSEVVLSAGEASCVASAGVAKKVAKEKVVKEKKEKPVKEKKVKESVYRGGVFASLVTESVVESVREESVCASESVREESEEESSSRCYIVSKKEAACAAAKKMSSGLPKLSR